MPARRRQARQRYVLDLAAENALITCPPPWEPIDAEVDEYLAGLVEANLSKLLARHAERPGSSSWALVRYHADPDIAREIVDAHRAQLDKGDPRRPALRDPQLDALDRWAAGRF
jgi:hypothetical protein